MLRSILSSLIIVSFFITSILGPDMAMAQALILPKAGTMVMPTPAFMPVMMKGVQVHPENPLLFDFILDTGKSGLKTDGQAFKSESQKLIKYFLAALTIKEGDLWVNLSPYEKDRMIPEELGKTELGRDMLAQDYLLKQLTASLIYPEKDLGQAFWKKVYAQAQEKFGTTDIPVDTFNKVWIVADKAKVLERKNAAYVIGSHLKVMMERDYLAASNNMMPAGENGISQTPTPSQELARQIIKEVILPAIEKEVNEGENFAPLRQMYYAMILASWYKLAIKDALLNQVYSNKGKTGGVLSDDPAVKEKIYAQYVESFKKGVFNYIKEDVQAAEPAAVAPSPSMPRKYFSGGEVLDVTNILDRAQTGTPQELMSVKTGDMAMVSAVIKKAISDALLMHTGFDRRLLRFAQQSTHSETVKALLGLVVSSYKELQGKEPLDLRCSKQAERELKQGFDMSVRELREGIRQSLNRKWYKPVPWWRPLARIRMLQEKLRARYQELMIAEAKVLVDAVIATYDRSIPQALYQFLAANTTYERKQILQTESGRKLYPVFGKVFLNQAVIDDEDLVDLEEIVFDFLARVQSNFGVFVLWQNELERLYGKDWGDAAMQSDVMELSNVFENLSPEARAEIDAALKQALKGHPGQPTDLAMANEAKATLVAMVKDRKPQELLAFVNALIEQGFFTGRAEDAVQLIQDIEQKSAGAMFPPGTTREDVARLAAVLDKVLPDSYLRTSLRWILKAALPSAFILIGVLGISTQVLNPQGRYAGFLLFSIVVGWIGVENFPRKESPKVLAGDKLIQDFYQQAGRKLYVQDKRMPNMQSELERDIQAWVLDNKEIPWSKKQAVKNTLLAGLELSDTGKTTEGSPFTLFSMTSLLNSDVRFQEPSSIVELLKDRAIIIQAKKEDVFVLPGVFERFENGVPAEIIALGCDYNEVLKLEAHFREHSPRRIYQISIKQSSVDAAMEGWRIIKSSVSDWLGIAKWRMARRNYLLMEIKQWQKDKSFHDSTMDLMQRNSSIVFDDHLQEVQRQARQVNETLVSLYIDVASVEMKLNMRGQALQHLNLAKQLAKPNSGEQDIILSMLNALETTNADKAMTTVITSYNTLQKDIETTYMNLMMAIENGEIPDVKVTGKAADRELRYHGGVTTPYLTIAYGNTRNYLTIEIDRPDFLGVATEIRKKIKAANAVDRKHTITILARSGEYLMILIQASDVVMEGQKDFAAVVNPLGGINLNVKNTDMDVAKNGQGIEMKFDPAMIAEFQEGNFTGVEGVILKIVPIQSPLPMLGV